MYVNTSASSDGQESDERDPTSLCANGIQRRQCNVQFAGKQVPLTQVADVATSDRGRSNRRVVFCEWTLKMRENVSGQSWLGRLSLCVDMEGRHVEHILKLLRQMIAFVRIK
ncbi:hypothetical protein AVEN_119164-1 [Araneus ventricosus]|uniref:Uncharacterized protein n=1 Tax=Araneus ventricosus TaxID=182803 RepID=A0A4Y2JXP0_ARAVE|nr:hypothetical protein AVEN_119164-1 [Araneus ventricosus]